MKSLRAAPNDAGFTLVELMMAVFLTTIVSAGIYRIYEEQQMLYRQQESVVDMQQNSRAAIYLIGQELRMAGFDLLEVGGTGIQPNANSTSIRYTQDLNSDRAIAGANEDVTLAYDPVTSNITLNGQPFLQNIDFFEMVYNMKDGASYLIPPAGTLEEIQSIQVTLLIRSSYNQINFVNNLIYRGPQPFSTPINGGAPFNDGFRRRMISTEIQLRNASL